MTFSTFAVLLTIGLSNDVPFARAEGADSLGVDIDDIVVIWKGKKTVTKCSYD
jgi:hypothetical protein